MAFLLEHLPPQLHLVIATRADPALPLARLRGRGELVEIRAADLRFTPDEAAAYLNEVMESGPDGAGCRGAGGADRRLDRRPAAGGALDPGPRRRRRLHRRASPGTTATSSTTWSKRSCTVSPNMSASFLLQTSILGRLTGPLCDAVTGQEGGTAMLEALDRGNLFLVPLDDRRRWYRYHQLFADVLRTRLLRRAASVGARPAPSCQRLVRAQRRPLRGNPARAGGRRLRPSRQPD